MKNEMNSTPSIYQSFTVVTDFVEANCGTDVSDALQRIIDENPNRTIYFPDGEYLLSKPLLTPADATKSVSLKLADFAVLRAAEGWAHDEAMLRLGGKDPKNDIRTPGSNYGIEGGIIDCRGVAKGLSIDSGRETYVRNLSIKNTVLGIHIKNGANSGSSDADIFGVNITGNATKEATGVLIEGHDNTFTNMRIAYVSVGVDVRSGGNMLRNIHPLYNCAFFPPEEYGESIGFKISHSMNNWFDYCYSDQFAVGFYTDRGGVFTNCFCFWYSDRQPRHIALKSEQPFSGRVSNLTVNGKHHPDFENILIADSEIADDAVFEHIRLGNRLMEADDVKEYAMLHP